MSVQMIVRDRTGRALKVTGGNLAERAAACAPELVPFSMFPREPSYRFALPPVASCRTRLKAITTSPQTAAIPQRLAG